MEEGSWLLISGLAVLNCYAFLPQRLLKVSLLNVWFIFFVIACILFAMPFNLPVFRIFDALVIALLLRIPTSLLATRTLWVALGNLTLSLLIVWRLWSSGTMLQSGSSLPLLLATMLECAVSSLAVVFSLVMSEIMRQRASLRCENKKISYDNSAISALLRLMSDAVIELDQDLRLIRHSPELSAMLMRDRPGASTEGLAFSDFIHSADAARAVELLLDPIGVTSESGTCAHAFHTRLVDTFSNKVCVEVFTIKTENAEGQVRHLLGLRDFTDSHSLSADRAMDAMDSAEDLPFSFSWPISSAESLRADITGSIRSDAAAITSSASTDQEWPIAGPVKKQAYLDLDMEVKVIASASSSVTFVAGLSLDDFFPSPHTLQLLQQVCDEAQRSFDSDGSIPNKVFNFEDLPVQWTPEKYGTLVGAFQVVRTRFGGLGQLFVVEEVHVSLIDDNEVDYVVLTKNPVWNTPGFRRAGLVSVTTPALSSFWSVNFVPGFQEASIHAFSRYAWANSPEPEFVDPAMRQSLLGFLGTSVIPVGHLTKQGFPSSTHCTFCFTGSV
eukprot:s3103_g1.t1